MLRYYRGYTIWALTDDDETVWAYDIHGPEQGVLPDPCAPQIDTVPTIKQAQAVIRDEIGYRQLCGRL